MSTPTTNDLGRVVTDPRARAAIYGTYVVLLVLAGATTIGFATISAGIPTWVAVTNAVLGYLGLPVSGLAIANITPKDAVVPANSTVDDSDIAVPDVAYDAANPENWSRIHSDERGHHYGRNST